MSDNSFYWDDNDLEELRKKVKSQLNIKEEKKEIKEQIVDLPRIEKKIKVEQTPSVKVPTKKPKSQTVMIKRSTKTPLQSVKRPQNYTVQTKKHPAEPRRSSVAPNFAMLHKKEKERIQKFRQTNKRICTTPSAVSLETQKRQKEKDTEEFHDGKEFFEFEKTPKEKIKKLLQEEEKENTNEENQDKQYNDTPSRCRSNMKYQSPSTSGFIHGFSEICKTPSGKFNNVLTNYGINKQPVQRKIKFDENISTSPVSINLDETYEPSDFVKSLLSEQLK
eukprot:gene1027-9931_t